MTRLWWDGAEDPDGMAVWTAYNGASVVTTPVRSGARAFLTPYGKYAYKIFTDISEGFFRIGWRISGNYNVFKTVRFRNDTTELITLGLDTANQYFQILVGGSVVATGTAIYQIDTFYLLEFRVKIDDTVGVAQMKVDGVIDIDYSGDTKPGTATTINNLALVSNYNVAVGAADVFFDDLAINDTTGAVDNSWCGDGRVIYLAPNAAGDATQLTPSAGANYAAVDDRPHDSGSTYVEGITVDNRDLYNL